MYQGHGNLTKCTQVTILTVRFLLTQSYTYCNFMNNALFLMLSILAAPGIFILEAVELSRRYGVTTLDPYGLLCIYRKFTVLFLVNLHVWLMHSTFDQYTKHTAFGQFHCTDNQYTVCHTMQSTFTACRVLNCKL